MPNPIEIDVLILGAGGGGYPAAFFLARAGLRVAMVDPFGNLGGDCLAEGCVPSKAVRESALLRGMSEKYKLFGLAGAEPSVDWPAVLANKDRVQNQRYSQHAADIAKSSMLFHKGRGRLLGDHDAEIVTDDGAVLHCHFRYLILGTGSRPHVLNIPGAELAITSHDLFRLGADLPFPKTLAVIGGGYIGAETASMLDRFGTKSTILEVTGQLLSGAAPELRAYLTRRLSSRCEVITGAEVVAIARAPGALSGGLHVRYRLAGKEMSLDADAVLMATGRETVTPEGMAALGLPARGPVAVDTSIRTAVAHFYAPGDVNGRSMLFHSAVRQSLVAAHNIVAGGQIVDRMNFHSVPFTVFTEPEVAWVGYDESAARVAGLDVAATLYDYIDDSRAQIFDETDGFIKLVFDTGTGSLVGAQVAGIEAAQLIAPLALAVQEATTATILSEVVFPHPMISEGINKAARKFRP